MLLAPFVFWETDVGKYSIEHTEKYLTSVEEKIKEMRVSLSKIKLLANTSTYSYKDGKKVASEWDRLADAWGDDENIFASSDLVGDNDNHYYDDIRPYQSEEDRCGPDDSEYRKTPEAQDDDEDDDEDDD